MSIVTSLNILWYILGLSLMALLHIELGKGARQLEAADDVVELDEKTKVIIDRINIKDGNGQLRLSLKPEDLLYLESSDNYVVIYFRKNQRIGRELIRNSLKNLENDLKNYNCIRCHRSFIVNLQNALAIKKQGRAYNISMEGVQNLIPISRGYVKAVTEMISE